MVIRKNKDGSETRMTWEEYDALKKAEQEAAEAKQAAFYAERRKIEEACSTCQEYKRHGFGPSHFASSNCQSGKHNHCTCDTCF